MPNQIDVPSHCVVQWDDNQEQFAVVDTRRSKTVAAMKIGSSTLFEGYQRERRRGKILFLGMKKDCMVFGYDIVECDTQLNVYSWSSPPGLREQAEEVTNAIQGGVASTLQRTLSSSSTTLTNKSKRKKTLEKNANEIDAQTAFHDKFVGPSSISPGPSSSSSETTNSSEKRVVDNPSSNSNIQSTSSNSNAQSTSSISISSTTNTLNNQEPATGDADTETLLDEIKALKEKILALQNDLIYVKETSIALPSEEVYLFMKLICEMYERVKSEQNKKAIELGKNLPCTPTELVLSKKTNPAATINKLVEYCFKDVQLSSMCYEKLKTKDPDLVEQIYEYIKLIHAPTIIPPGRFSEIISQRCRHMRSDEKNKSSAPKLKKFKVSSSKNQKRASNKQYENEDIPNPSNEVIIDNDEDKENSMEIF